MAIGSKNVWNPVGKPSKPKKIRVLDTIVIMGSIILAIVVAFYSDRDVSPSPSVIIDTSWSKRKSLDSSATFSIVNDSLQKLKAMQEDSIIWFHSKMRSAHKAKVKSKK